MPMMIQMCQSIADHNYARCHTVKLEYDDACPGHDVGGRLVLKSEDGENEQPMSGSATDDDVLSQTYMHTEANRSGGDLYMPVSNPPQPAEVLESRSYIQLQGKENDETITIMKRTKHGLIHTQTTPKIRRVPLRLHKIDRPEHACQMYKCHLCQKQQKKRTMMYFHIESTHAGEYRWKCDKCRIPFLTEGEHSYHVTQCQFVSTCKSHSCIACNHQRLFVSKRLLLAHLKESHDNVLPLSCSRCNLPLASEFDQREHMSMHDESILKCLYCSRISETVIESDVHLMSHLRDYPFTCYICDREVSTYATLQQHVYRHFDNIGSNITYMCDLCGASFVHAVRHARHIKRCRKDIECGLCGEAFARVWDLREHEYSEHSDVKRHQCKLCGKNYAHKPQLTTHIKQIHGKDTFKCDTCQKAFKNKVTLERHIFTHKDLLPYECDYCKKKFRIDYNLKAHLRQHTGEKPYSCTNCGLAFTHNVSRKNHEKKCTPTLV